MGKVDLNINVVVVDDDMQVLEVIVEYLEYFGLCNVKQFTKPNMALNYIQDVNNKIDIIFSDWEMKHLSGLDLLKAVRGNKYRKDTPFIMVTSQSSMERVKITRAVQSKVDAYIIKPFRADVLKDKIWDILGWNDEETEEAS